MIALASFFDTNETRPRNRAECRAETRPCIWVSCRYHLLLEVTQEGKLKFNDPSWTDPTEQRGRETCALDVADRGEHSLEETGEIVGLMPERVRQVEAEALVRVRATIAAARR